MRLAVSVMLAASAALLCACTTDSTLRHEGVTAYAGDAIAANTALQMVDPWPYGAQETDLKTPAVRVTAKAAVAAPAAPAGSPATNP
jgi:hypothetical protein